MHRNFLKWDLENHGHVLVFYVQVSMGTLWLVERLYSFILHSFSVRKEEVSAFNAGYSRCSISVWKGASVVEFGKVDRCVDTTVICFHVSRKRRTAEWKTQSYFGMQASLLCFCSGLWEISRKPFNHKSSNLMIKWVVSFQVHLYDFKK